MISNSIFVMKGKSCSSKLKSFLLVTLCLCNVTSCKSDENLQLDNPEITVNEYNIPVSDLKARDPFIFVDKKNQCYYLYVSRFEGKKGGIYSYKSKDLLRWKENGFVFQAPDGYLGTDDFWAPDFYEYKGEHYAFITVSNAAQGILRGTTILKSTTGADGHYMPILPADQLHLMPADVQSLDGSLYVDDDGKPWMIYCVEWNGPNVENRVGEVWAQRLKEDLTSLIGEAVCLFKATDAVWPVRCGADGGYITDAPFIWKDEVTGKLIMTWSSFGFGPLYSIGQATSTNGILGPWVHEKTPIFSDNGGHAEVFKDLQGKLKIVFHSPNEATATIKETVTIKDIRIVDGKFESIETK